MRGYFSSGKVVGSLSKNQRLKIDDNGEGKTKVSWIATELRFHGLFLEEKKL